MVRGYSSVSFLSSSKRNFFSRSDDGEHKNGDGHAANGAAPPRPLTALKKESGPPWKDGSLSSRRKRAFVP